SLVFAITHKALVYASTSGLEDAWQLMRGALGTVDGLPHKSVARVAAYTRMGQLGVQLYDLERARRYLKKAEDSVDDGLPPNRHYVILNHAMAQLCLSAQDYQTARHYTQKAYDLNLQVEGEGGALMVNIWQTSYFTSYYNGDYNQA